MVTQRQNAAIDLYSQIMEEIKARLSCVHQAAHSKTGLPNPAAREFCFLQFRMICELIALGCLTTHGDIEATTQLRDQYSAKNIIKALEKLHKNFYPFPSTMETTGRHHHLTPLTDGFLTKKALLELNGKCGDILHRGSLEKLLSRKHATEATFDDIQKWAKQIATLLEVHSISLLGGDAYVICILSDVHANGNVRVVFAQSRAG